jgi:hypothetical protein
MSSPRDDDESFSAPEATEPLIGDLHQPSSSNDDHITVIPIGADNDTDVTPPQVPSVYGPQTFGEYLQSVYLSVYDDERAQPLDIFG